MRRLFKPRSQGGFFSVTGVALGALLLAANLYLSSCGDPAGHTDKVAYAYINGDNIGWYAGYWPAGHGPNVIYWDVAARHAGASNWTWTQQRASGPGHGEPIYEYYIEVFVGVCDHVQSGQTEVGIHYHWVDGHGDAQQDYITNQLYC